MNTSSPPRREPCRPRQRRHDFVAGGGAQATTTTFYPGTADQAGAQAITIAAGAEISNVVFTMQSAPAFRVSGIVVDENGKPVSGAMVMLMTDPRAGGTMFGPGGGAQSREDGTFTIGDVTAGIYRAMAMIMNINSASAGALGGASASSFVSLSTGGGTMIGGAGMTLPTEIVVTDADVNGVRVVTRGPNP